MKILSIDVGIKNLAFCLFEKPASDSQFKVTKWDIVNISEQEDNLLCGFTEKNVECNKPAKFKKDDKCFCLKHSKKQNGTILIPKLEQKAAFINKQKIAKLYEIANNYNIKYEPKIKKVDLILLINGYISKHYFEIIESKKAAEVNLFNIGINKRNANASNKNNNPFSHGYAKSIGYQPKARASARIGLGGLF
jgi:hypothetical protein